MLIEILHNIQYIVHPYDGGEYQPLHEMHRELTCNMYYLSKEQVEYNVK